MKLKSFLKIILEIPKGQTDSGKSKIIVNAMVLWPKWNSY